MIHHIKSSLSSFKALSFRPGLNVVLAQMSPGATGRQTRNGVGKSSIVELIHFLLGSSCKKNHLLKADQLERESYFMRFDLAGGPIEVERSPRIPSRIAFSDGDISAWPVSPRLDRTSGILQFSNARWKEVIGYFLFGLPLPADDDRPFGPGFRPMFSYFARRQNDGGFMEPTRYAAVQQQWDAQVSVSYLLGLDASIPQELQAIRQREKALVELRKAAKQGALGEYLASAPELRTRLTVHEARLSGLRDQLSSFHVIPEYRALEIEATQLTNEIADRSNDNHADSLFVSQIDEALSEEEPPDFRDVRRAYDEAGLALPDLVVRRFEDVARFHRSVIENRRSHLRAEMDAARRRIDDRARVTEVASHRRAQIMQILSSGGALEAFARLQEELSRLEYQTESLRRQYDAAEALGRSNAELKVERARIRRRLQDDHHEQKGAVQDAILSFEKFSQKLYERAGELRIADTENGPTYEIHMEASRSTGIRSMQIFCFDMMLMELCAKRGYGPGFLIHDSHLFDGVDERQIARALEIGAEMAQEHKFQYIVTLNEDAVPVHAFQAGFEFDKFVLPIRLTDAKEDGGLFGVRFE